VRDEANSRCTHVCNSIGERAASVSTVRYAPERVRVRVILKPAACVDY
jgi:hypothetical protein